MSIIGKIVGALLGLLLFRSVAGAIIGVVLGHVYDKTVAHLRPPSMEHGLIDPLFAMAGALAKSDGRVSESEITATEALMTYLRLNPEQRQQAIEQFTHGKQEGFNTYQAIAQLSAWCQGRGDLAIIVIDLLLDLVYAEGELVQAKAVLLRRLCVALRVSEQTFAWLASAKGYAWSRPGPSPDFGRGPQAPPRPPPSGVDPYAVLGIERDASERDIKKAWRRLISQHHPDKLGDVPDELKRRAEERARDINAAYERIKVERGFR
ncbi:MAG: co-chaperone DjlA [Rhodanobacter sp.]|jgi:DnaJ like chaperone protein|nr:co-chaperone DjlA [Rhodanobacter sp.]